MLPFINTKEHGKCFQLLPVARKNLPFSVLLGFAQMEKHYNLLLLYTQIAFMLLNDDKQINFPVL